MMKRLKGMIKLMVLIALSINNGCHQAVTLTAPLQPTQEVVPQMAPQINPERPFNTKVVIIGTDSNLGINIRYDFTTECYYFEGKPEEKCQENSNNSNAKPDSNDNNASNENDSDTTITESGDQASNPNP